MEARYSRFHGEGTWPPALPAIIKSLQKAYKKHGYLTSPNEFRGLCTSADGSYTRGSADDCLRLFKNAGVLISGSVGNKTRLLIDLSACQTLLDCFLDDRQPDFPSEEDVSERVGALLKSLRRRTSRSSRSKISAPAAKPLVAAPTTFPTTSTTTSTPVHSEVSMADAPAPRTKPARTEPAQRFVCFLPPGAAREVWLYLYVCATRVPDLGTRVPVANDHVPDGVDCSAERFDHWLDVFARAGVIECVGESGSDNRAFAFKIHPDEIHTVEIDDRKRVAISRDWIEIMHRARREISAKDLRINCLNRALTAWVRTHFPRVSDRTTCKKLMGYHGGEQRPTANWGIFYKPAMAETYLPCLPGLEPFDFEATDKSPERRVRHKPIKAALAVTKPPIPPHASVETEPPAKPEPPESIAPPPEPTEPATVPTQPPLTAELLLAQVRNQRARLEEAERLLTQLALDQERRQTLVEELTQLDASLAQMRERLTTLGFDI